MHVYYLQNKFIKISEADKQFIQNTKELEFAYKITKVLTTNYENNDEVYYIAILLLAGNVITNYSKNISLINLCRDGLVKMLNSIEQNNYLFFKDKEQLISGIINHLVPAYYRLKFNLKVEYEYINSVKVKYKDFYLITKNNIKYLEEVLHVNFNDDEILLISLYIVSNLLSDIDSIKKIKTVIVSNEGVNICNILKLEIEKTFYNLDIVDILSVAELNLYCKHYDLILSFVDIKKPNFIKIKSILTNNDKKRINE
ncbi:MAG: PRD domain-containing protein [Clostridia bacterium]